METMGIGIPRQGLPFDCEDFKRRVLIFPAKRAE
jgi:hypothetical protein